MKTDKINQSQSINNLCMRVCTLPGGGISRSVVCWTLVLPGRGSKAGTRAENCLFRTKSSSHVLLRPPLVSYSSSSCKGSTAVTSILVTELAISVTKEPKMAVLPRPPRTPGPPDCHLHSHRHHRLVLADLPRHRAQPIGCWRDNCLRSLEQSSR